MKEQREMQTHIDELNAHIKLQDNLIEKLERNAAPKVIQLGRLILGDTQCRLYFAEDGKMHMYCGRGAQEFIKFAPEPTPRQLQRLRQEAWKSVRDVYRDDTEVCFAMGFDAGYGAVARKVEPSQEECGGFDSRPASLKRQWVELTGTEINHIFAANVGYPERMCHAIEAKLKELNT